MCGINGFNWKDEYIIEKMNHRLKHRGPDDEGIHADDFVSLGHVRLSIIDLSQNGHQPMSDSKGRFYIIYNGEVYNFNELRDELESSGYTFKSNTDTEVILYSYIHWKERCLEKFNGMFAFSIYDSKNKKLFLARDRMGIKPLYYYLNNEAKKFIFSSEIPPLMEHVINIYPNKKLIKDFLLYNIVDHTDETFFQGINKIPKGCYATFDLMRCELEIREWYDVKYEERFKGTYEDAVSILRDLMVDSVNLRLISDVPVGTCLSGGIDSSAIACLINREMKVKTFSAVYDGYERDESKYITIVAEKTGMENFKTRPSPEHLRKDLMKIIALIGEPFPSASIYAQNCVQKLAKISDVTVVLDGQGADEQLAGYHYFLGFYLVNLLKKFRFKRFASEFLDLIEGRNYLIGLQFSLYLLLPVFIRKQLFARESLLSRQLMGDGVVETEYFKNFSGCESLGQALEFHMKYRLEQLLKWEDRNSMGNQTESRVPFLDYRIIEFLSGLPADFLIRKGRTKALLRDAMIDIVPAEILDRRDKIGYETPDSHWLRSGDFKKLLDDWFVQDEPLCRDYIDQKKLRQQIIEHVYKNKNHARNLWKAIFLEAWLKTYFPGSNPVPDSI